MAEGRAGGRDVGGVLGPVEGCFGVWFILPWYQIVDGFLHWPATNNFIA